MAEYYIGEIRLVAWPRIPNNWAPCDGRLLPLAEYEALYTLIGTTYGGDGVSTFAVPDLRGRVPLHVSPTSPLGQKQGTEEVTLLTAQLPTHTHAFSVNNEGPGTLDTPNNNYPAASAKVTPYSNKAAAISFAASSVTSFGGSQPHDNMMPTLTASFIIALNGIYPSPA